MKVNDILITPFSGVRGMYFGSCHASVMEFFKKTVNNFLQQSLNSSSAQVQTLVAVCRRFAIV